MKTKHAVPILLVLAGGLASCAMFPGLETESVTVLLDTCCGRNKPPQDPDAPPAVRTCQNGVWDDWCTYCPTCLGNQWCLDEAWHDVFYPAWLQCYVNPSFGPEGEWIFVDPSDGATYIFSMSPQEAAALKSDVASLQIQNAALKAEIALLRGQ